MGVSDQEVTIATGRRADDRRLRLSIFAEGLLSLGMEGHGERVPTLLLTLEQAKSLRDALAQLIPLAAAEEGAAAHLPPVEAWQGTERRMVGR